MKSFLIQKHIRLLANFAILSGILFSAWGFIVTYFEPIYDYSFFRVSISVIFIYFGIHLYKSKSTLYRIEWIFALISLLPVSYVLYVTNKFGLRATWIAGTCLIIFGVLNFLTYRAPFLFFTIPTLVMGYLSLPEIDSPSVMSKWSVLLNYSSSIFFGYYSSLLRYKLIVQGTNMASYQDVVLNTMTEGAILIDSENNVVISNKIANDLFENINQNKIDIFFQGWTFHEEVSSTASSLATILGKVRETREPIKHQIYSVQKIGKELRWMELSLVPRMTREAEIKETLVTFRDITESKQMKERIKQQETSLVIASRLSSLGEMAAGIAHEINNPLTAILGRSEMLKRNIAKKISTDEIAVAQLDIIIATTHRISRIITSMRSLSRQSEKIEFSKHLFSDTLNDVLSISSERMKLKNISLHLDVQTEVIIHCDSGQISQVLLNLINNSMDAIEQLEERWIKIETKTMEDVFTISFTDSGGGIPHAIKDKIMQPFFTTKEFGKGTGLGLSLVQTIIANHGGKIMIDDTYPNTRFVISLKHIT